jgi:hypothetical protein
MPDELLFTVEDKQPRPAAPIGLAEAGLKERQDLQEWVINHPQILGADVFVVTSEFAGWASTKGDKDLDRLDVLGLASDGRLVLAELKRGKAPSTVGMQALNYAARASLFTISKLSQVYQQFLNTRGTKVSADQARERLQRHAPELSDETLTDVPRLALVASDFGLDVTTTAVFLTRKLAVQIELVRVQAYRTASADIVISVSRTFPPPDMDEMVLFPNVQQEQERKLEKAREKNTVSRLLAADAIADGTSLRLNPGSEMTAAKRKVVMAWVAEDPARGRVTWRAHPSAPLIWEVDGKQYSPTGLVKHIADQAGVEVGSIAGPRSWRDAKGRTLPEIADSAAVDVGE